MHTMTGGEEVSAAKAMIISGMDRIYLEGQFLEKTVFKKLIL